MDHIVVIEGEISLSHSIAGEIELTTQIEGEIEKVFYVDASREVYEGDYVVTPLVHNEVVLETNGKYMEDDVTVLKVPYLETANISGGNTAWIGENI